MVDVFLNRGLFAKVDFNEWDVPPGVDLNATTIVEGLGAISGVVGLDK